MRKGWFARPRLLNYADGTNVRMKKTLKVIISALIILLICYFYLIEVKKNWMSLQDFKFVFNVYYLMIALSFYLFSYILETFIWQVCINRHLGRHELNLTRSIAVVNASGLLKYVPGRIWTYTAQLLWLEKYNISKSLILYVNLICIAGSVIVSLYLSLIYLAMYTNIFGAVVLIALSTALILFNIAYIAWNSILMNKLITIINHLFKRDIQPLNESMSLIILIQSVYICSWALMGAGGYFLAEGVGLKVPLTDIFAILAAMSLSWLIGYFAVFSPGGLGIREGFMLLMLNGVTNTATALIFPLISRLMYLIAEGFLGVAAILFGFRHNVFLSGRSDINRKVD